MNETSKVRVWWVQCKPFNENERNSEQATEFQNECLQGNFFGMGWKWSEFNEYSGSEFNWEIASVFKNKVKSRTFSAAQKKYGSMNSGDVVFTRLNGIYYAGIISFKPKVSGHERLTWYSNVDNWIKIGSSEELPHHVRGKISSKVYQGTVAEIDGLSALTLMSMVGIHYDKQIINSENFHESIGDEDLEDLMAHFMSIKNKGYIFLPSSCKKNTPGIEYIMYDPISEKTIACQTKVNRWINVGYYLSNEAYNAYETIYLFSGAGCYNYKPSELKNVYIVSREELFEVLKNNKRFCNIVSKFFDFN